MKILISLLVVVSVLAVAAYLRKRAAQDDCFPSGKERFSLP